MIPTIENEDALELPYMGNDSIFWLVSLMVPLIEGHFYIQQKVYSLL